MCFRQCVGFICIPIIANTVPLPDIMYSTSFAVVLGVPFTCSSGLNNGCCLLLLRKKNHRFNSVVEIRTRWNRKQSSRGDFSKALSNMSYLFQLSSELCPYCNSYLYVSHHGELAVCTILQEVGCAQPLKTTLKCFFQKLWRCHVWDMQ